MTQHKGSPSPTHSLSHGLLTGDELAKVEDIIMNEFSSYIDIEKTARILFKKVVNGEVNQQEFRILVTFLFE